MTDNDVAISALQRHPIGSSRWLIPSPNYTHADWVCASLVRIAGATVRKTMDGELFVSLAVSGDDPGPLNAGRRLVDDSVLADDLFEHVEDAVAEAVRRAKENQHD